MQLAIITARGGSKRIPRKNVKLFLGKPMLAWAIEAALKAGCYEHILVSTDDIEIADVAVRYGAKVPFLRPQPLADDYTPAYVAARHMLEWAMQAFGEVDVFSHIYPTSPALSPKLLDRSVKLIKQGEYKAVWGVIKIPYPVYQLMSRDADGQLKRLFSKDKVTMRSQDMPSAFIDVGQFYSFDVMHFLQHEIALVPGVTGLEVPYESAVDIDTEEDWLRSEILIKNFLDQA